MKPSILLVFLVGIVIISCGCASPSAPAAATPTPSVPVTVTPSPTTVPSTTMPATVIAPVETTRGSVHTDVLQGAGDDVRFFTVTNGPGIVTFDMKSTGSANFIVWLEDAQGNRINQIVDAVGAYSGKRSEQLNEGNYYLDITSNGQWSVTITSPA